MCLPAARCDEGLLEIGKVSVTAINMQNTGTKTHLSKEVAETFIDIVILRKFTNYFKYNNVNMIPAKGPAYFGRVPSGYGKTSP